MVDRVADLSLSASGNTSIAGVNSAENNPVANLNNVDREIMALIRQEFSDQGVTAVAAALTTVSGASEFKPLAGNTTITGFDTAVTGMYRELKVLGTPLLVNSSGLAIQGGANYQAAAGDLLRARSLGAGSWIVEPPVPSVVGKHLIPFNAEGIRASTTNGPASGTTETTTNKVNFATLDFDATTAESGWIKFPAPTSADESRGLTFEYDWTYAATATGAGVSFSLAVLASSDGDTLDTAPGTAVTVTDSKLGSGIKHTSAESTTVTPSGSWAAGDMLFAKIARVPSDAADLVTADAQLMAVRLFMYINQATDTTP